MGKFMFGGISTTKKAKDLARVRFDPLIVDNFNERAGDYYLFVLDQKPSVDKVSILQRKISDVGIRNYAIVTAVDVIFTYEVEKSITPFFVANDSKWAKKYVVRRTSDGGAIKAKAVMTFGPAMYGLNKSADIMAENFYAGISILDRTHYYSPAIGTNVFPVDHLSWVLPPVNDPKAGFETYKTRFFYWQLKKMQRNDAWMPDMRDPIIEICETAERANEIFAANMKSELVAWDLETSGLDFFRCRIGCLTICFDGMHGYFIPWTLVDKRKFAICLMSCKKRVGANLKFDTKFIWHDGVRWPTVTDATDMLSHALHSERYKGLKPLAYFYSKFGGYDDELDVFKKQTKVNDYTKIPVQILSKYATMDAIVTFRVFYALLDHVREVDRKYPNEKLPEWTIERFYNEIMMPVYNDFCELEYRGTFVNYDILKRNKKELEEKLAKADAALREIWKLDKDFNLYSTTNLGRLLMKMGWEPPPEINAKGEYATSEPNIIFWEQLDKPGIKKLKELRSIYTMLSMFLGALDKNGKETGWPQYIRKHEDGTFRMHPNFSVMGTSTYRCIGREPNMQQIPSSAVLAKYAKQCIGTPDNSKYKLVTFDYSALQTRLAGRDTVLNPQGVDPMLFELYREGSTLGGDMHGLTAHGVFCEPCHRKLIQAVDDEDGKVWIFGHNQFLRIRPRNENAADIKCDEKKNYRYQEVIGTDIKPTDKILDYAF